MKTWVIAATVLTLAASQVFGVTRTYYIAADEVVWNFAPSGIDQIHNAPFNSFQA